MLYNITQVNFFVFNKPQSGERSLRQQLACSSYTVLEFLTNLREQKNKEERYELS